MNAERQMQGRRGYAKRLAIWNFFWLNGENSPIKGSEPLLNAIYEIRSIIDENLHVALIGFTVNSPIIKGK